MITLILHCLCIAVFWYGIYDTRNDPDPIPRIWAIFGTLLGMVPFVGIAILALFTAVVYANTKTGDKVLAWFLKPTIKGDK